MDLEKRQAEQGLRLKSERKRLGQNQETFANACGVSRRTQVHYEKGTRVPTNDYWFEASDLGVDITFVLDGIRTHLPDPDSEGELSIAALIRAKADSVELICMINNVMSESGLDFSDRDLYKKVLNACVELEQNKSFVRMSDEERKIMQQALVAVCKLL